MKTTVRETKVLVLKRERLEASVLRRRSAALRPQHLHCLEAFLLPLHSEPPRPELMDLVHLLQRLLVHQPHPEHLAPQLGLVALLLHPACLEPRLPPLDFLVALQLHLQQEASLGALQLPPQVLALPPRLCLVLHKLRDSLDKHQHRLLRRVCLVALRRPPQPSEAPARLVRVQRILRFANFKITPFCDASYIISLVCLFSNRIDCI